MKRFLTYAGTVVLFWLIFLLVPIAPVRVLVAQAVVCMILREAGYKLLIVNSVLSVIVAALILP